MIYSWAQGSEGRDVDGSLHVDDGVRGTRVDQSTGKECAQSVDTPWSKREAASSAGTRPPSHASMENFGVGGIVKCASPARPAGICPRATDEPAMKPPVQRQLCLPTHATLVHQNSQVCETSVSPRAVTVKTILSTCKIDVCVVRVSEDRMDQRRSLGVEGRGMKGRGCPLHVFSMT